MLQNKDGELRLFSLFGLFSFFIFVNISFASSFEDFKKVQSESFTHYKDIGDNKFNKYIKEEWQEYQGYITPALYKKSKPKSISSLRKKKSSYVGPIVKLNIPKKKNFQENNVSFKELPNDVKFDFFGKKLGFSLDRTIEKAKFYPENQSGIANFFSIIASSNYDATLREIKFYRTQMHLNDWALYLLVTRLSYAIYNNRNDARIYAWYLFNKLTYDVKIALTNNKNIYLLFYSKNILYSTPRYSFKNKNYYILSKYKAEDIKHIYTYSQKYPGANRALDFALNSLPHLAKKMLSKKSIFKDNAKVYEFSYKYNQNLIDFMKSYPQVNYDIYFNAPMEEETYIDMLKQIKHYTDGMKMSEALNFLLRFVQKAFQYERDKEQFGHEKVMFAEETLVYKASDCEDRAVLFAYLVKHIFGISVVGVKYKDHMSTALYIPLQGDSLLINRKKYVIADPTYINAEIGEIIPKYKNIQPEDFIFLRKDK